MSAPNLRPSVLAARAAIAGLGLILLASAGCSKHHRHQSPSEETTSEDTVGAAAATDVSGNSPDCDTFLQTQGETAPSTTCSATERVAFKKSPKCLECLLHSACLNEKQGATDRECEGSSQGSGFASGSPEEKACLNLLSCDFGKDPATGDSVIHGGVNNGPLRAFCGTDPVTKCWGADGPKGPCKDQVAAAYPSTMAAQQISLNIAQRKFPGGRAGAIIGCGDNNDCSACFK
jgi:hypothetical protein